MPNYDQHTYHYGYEDEGTPAPKSPRWVLIAIVAALVLLILGLCIGIFANVAKDKPVIIAPSASSPAAAAPNKGRPASVAPAKTPALPTSVSDGEYEVGKDIAAGRYRTAGADQGLVSLCTYSISKTQGGSDYIDVGTVTGEKEQAYVTLKKGQWFKAQGCQPWARQ